jgi:hypothetical protein
MGGGLGDGSGEETVDMATSIRVTSHDLARWVDPNGLGKGRAGHIERGVDAVREQETVNMGGSIDVSSHDLARGVDPQGIGLDRAGHIERGVVELGLHLSRYPKVQDQSHQAAGKPFHRYTLAL